MQHEQYPADPADPADPAAAADGGDGGDPDDPVVPADAVRDRPDESLLEAARVGDPTAVEQLCTRHQPTALTLARGHASYDYPAQDLAADAMLRMLSALTRGHGPRTSVPAYLAATIRNLAVSAARRRAHPAHPHPIAPETLHEIYAATERRSDPVRAVLDAETRAELTAAISRLQPAARQILHLLHDEYLTVQQCAHQSHDSWVSSHRSGAPVVPEVWCTRT